MMSPKKLFVLIAISTSAYGLTSCGPTTFISAGVDYTNPGWAPPYESGVRYYYIPDIEAYYDLSTQEFSYLDNGQWLFSYGLPPMYSSFDLNNCFVVSLNRSVYQPWMHHEYYVAHYPRYYYRTTYRNENISTIRGFSENNRKPITWNQQNGNRNNNNNGNNNRPVKQAPVRKSDQQQTKPQQPNYHDKNVGQPVKVKSHMRENKSPNKPSNTPNKPGNQPRGKGKRNGN